VSVGVLDPDIATVLYLPPVISPVVSAIVTTLFCSNLPVVESKRATALSVDEAGHTTSPAIIFPLPRIEVEFIVFMLVPDTRVSCFPASQDVSAEVSDLSVLRFEKFVLISSKVAFIASVDSSV
jgi:hypothetical protein